MTRWAIQVNIADAWEQGDWIETNGEQWADGREPVTYATRAEAERELADHLASMAEAGMEFEPTDWRVAPFNQEQPA
jgi:hypothetical protein